MVEKWRRKKERKIVVNKLDRNFVSKVEKFSETKFTNLLLPPPGVDFDLEIKPEFEKSSIVD